jgi:hypothetical protein
MAGVRLPRHAYFPIDKCPIFVILVNECSTSLRSPMPTDLQAVGIWAWWG